MKHHIIPRCVGGEDKLANLVRLTVREHRLAHKLLAKFYRVAPDRKRVLERVSLVMYRKSPRSTAKRLMWDPKLTGTFKREALAQAATLWLRGKDA